jgi:hypothetical protein
MHYVTMTKGHVRFNCATVSLSQRLYLPLWDKEAAGFAELRLVGVTKS